MSDLKLLPRFLFHTDLFPRGDEDQRGLLGRVLQDGMIDGLGHGEQSRSRVRHVQALDVELQRNGTHVGVEIERRVRRATQPTW